MENKKTKKQKRIIIILFILGIMLTIGGGVLTYLSSPNYVSKVAFKQFSKKATELIESRIETGLEDNYKKTSNIKIALNSDYFQALASMNPSYATISKILKNLSNTENNITMIQDKDKKKMFFNLDSKLSGQSLINTKYLVENATAYYSIDGVTNTYVNNGNNNYFESLNSSTTTNENIKYIIGKATEALSSNLKEDYLSQSYTDKYKVITITLTEENQVNYMNEVLAELKKDKRANQILTGYNANFSNVKITEKDVQGTGTVKINIYLDKVLPQAKKYELELKNKNKLTYFKEGEKEIVEIKTGEEKAILEITTEGNKKEINIKDSNNTPVGTITISKTDTNYDLVANITDDETKLEFGYNHQITNLKKGNSYDSKSTVTLKITSQNMIILDGTIIVTGQTTSDTTINEDTSTSVLASSLTGTQTELLQQKIALTMLSLMS